MCTLLGARGDETIFFSDLLFSDYLPPLPFRDDYRDSLTPQDNEKTRTLTHTHETRGRVQCAQFPYTAVPCIRLLPPPPLLRGGFSRRHFQPEIQM